MGEPDDRLRSLIRMNPRFMEILRVARAVDAPSWAVGSGIIRDLVWDALHGAGGALKFKDIDLVFFNPRDLSPEGESRVEAQLKARLDLPWEAKNQARVHLWYESKFGFSVEPLTSIEDAVATWPETAVCVAVRLDRDDAIHVIAPFGLNDLFGLVLRRNPRRISREGFLRRAAAKDLSGRWPMVRVVEEPDDPNMSFQGP
jgi:hypothetical protein